MKKVLFALPLFLALAGNTQEILPKGYSPSEMENMARGDVPAPAVARGIASPPPYPALRNAAEWEEIQALTIAWTSFPGILKQIVAAARLETRVLILTENPEETEDYLMSNNNGGPAFTNLDNVTLIEGDFDSIWIRDYGANPVYGNEVDDLVMVDWIYNRITRPNDNTSPQYFADELGLELYTMTEDPDDLVNTGGNWMTDGFGTAFASGLILEENEPGNPYGVSSKTEEEIDALVEEYLGVTRYVKMQTLPYDGIHHIDMHMKLIDEETLLVGEYPEGTADGPQINANIEYVLSNFQSKFGTPYRIVRIPMPDSPSGLWPSSEPAAHYRTYTNGVFVNNTVIIPTYREQYDTTALRIWQELLPGYTITGIDSDNPEEPIIASSGAIHCITHSVGVEDPLLISHQPLPDTEDTSNPYEVTAYIRHRSGIASASLFWKTPESGTYNEIPMNALADNNWQAFIPAQPAGTTVHYYVHAEAGNGKQQSRPMPAPGGYWPFNIIGNTVNIAEHNTITGYSVFPNPAKAITCIRLENVHAEKGKISLINALGQETAILHNGMIPLGESRFFFDAHEFSPGLYHVRISTPTSVKTTPVMIQ